MAIAKGNERVKVLGEQLKIEQQLPPEVQKKLSKLRLACHSTSSQYDYTCFQTLDAQSRPKFHPGLIGNFKHIGPFEVLSMTSNPPAAKLRLLDPLRYLVFRLERTLETLRTSYPEESRLYEFEAFLYGDFPIPLINEYYCELVSAIQELEQRSMPDFDPRASSTANFRFVNGQDYLISRMTYRILTDSSYISELLSDQLASEIIQVISFQIELLLSTHASEHNGIDFNQIRFTLENLLQRGLQHTDKAQVNLLLAKIARKENDGLGACRLYHRAFKQGARFTFEDYLECLDNLAQNNQWGDAKIICQKARAGYKERYAWIPSYEVQERQRFYENYGRKLEEWHQRIQQKRSIK